MCTKHYGIIRNNQPTKYKPRKCSLNSQFEIDGELSADCKYMDFSACEIDEQGDHDQFEEKKARGDTILGCRDPFNMIMRKAGGEFLVR